MEFNEKEYYKKEYLEKEYSTDEFYMLKAINLAKKAVGWVNPNPMVGAVVVKDNKILSEGYHRKYGDLHAERFALENCKYDTEGATLYVTLEPCNHYGKTPPCTEIILEKKIKRVVVGCLDPNPLVSGKGIEKLRENGVEVRLGILEEECLQLNKVFFHFIKEKMPYVLMKFAMSLDGKISTYTGDSKWISSEKSREKVHILRHENSAIMVGVNTVLIDDPTLNIRLNGEYKNPIRIICDTHLKTPLNSKIVDTSKVQKTIIATNKRNLDKSKKYSEKGVEFIFQENQEKINLNYLMKELALRGIDSILLEGGSTLNWSAIECGIVNEIHAYISPKIIGGENAKTPIGGLGFTNIKDTLNLKNIKIDSVEEDILIMGQLGGN